VEFGLPPLQLHADGDWDGSCTGTAFNTPTAMERSCSPAGRPESLSASLVSPCPSRPSSPAGGTPGKAGLKLHVATVLRASAAAQHSNVPRGCSPLVEELEASSSLGASPVASPRTTALLRDDGLQARTAAGAAAGGGGGSAQP
jgi:hypothetical protein